MSSASHLPAVEAVIIDDHHTLSLTEVCQLLHIETVFVNDLIEHDIIQPRGRHENWQFDSICLHRTRLAVSFYHDLGVNLNGIALALDLIEQLNEQSDIN